MDPQPPDPNPPPPPRRHKKLSKVISGAEKRRRRNAILVQEQQQQELQALPVLQQQRFQLQQAVQPHQEQQGLQQQRFQLQQQALEQQKVQQKLQELQELQAFHKNPNVPPAQPKCYLCEGTNGNPISPCGCGRRWHFECLCQFITQYRDDRCWRCNEQYTTPGITRPEPWTVRLHNFDGQVAKPYAMHTVNIVDLQDQIDQEYNAAFLAGIHQNVPEVQNVPVPQHICIMCGGEEGELIRPCSCDERCHYECLCDWIVIHNDDRHPYCGEQYMDFRIHRNHGVTYLHHFDGHHYVPGAVHAVHFVNWEDGVMRRG